MTKDVIIGIQGLQFVNGDDDSIEVITNGSYYFKNGRHYLLYREIIDGYFQETRDTIIFDDKKFEIKKKGIVNTHMVFEERKKNMTYYEMPFGNMMIETNTKKVNVSETDNEITVKIEYGLSVNYAFIADCEITVRVSSRQQEMQQA